jgi:hypothetical protein
MSDGSIPSEIELVPEDTPLGACALWATMFSLPSRGERLLEELRRYRVGVSDRTQTASTRAIFAALILHLPERPEEIVAMSNYSAAAGPMPQPGTPADLLRRRTHVRLPAPLTLRLNRLIELAGEQTTMRCSRTAVVVSMMRVARQQEREIWVERFRTVLSRPARDAVPVADAEAPERVLRLERPLPGPRPRQMERTSP